MFKKIKITKNEMLKFHKQNEIDIHRWEKDLKFPKYTTQLINLFSNTAQATRARVVGQMTDLVPEFLNSERNTVTISVWKKWYLKKYPDAIEDATNKIDEKLKDYVEAINKIDRPMIKKWVEDFIFYKTYMGLVIQGIVLKKVAEFCHKEYRKATPKEESQGIDGFIGNTPVQIKPRNGEKYHVMMDIYPTKYTLIIYKKAGKSFLIEFDDSKIKC